MRVTNNKPRKVIVLWLSCFKSSRTWPNPGDHSDPVLGFASKRATNRWGCQKKKNSSVENGVSWRESSNKGRGPSEQSILEDPSLRLPHHYEWFEDQGGHWGRLLWGKECSRRVTPQITAISMAVSDERELGPMWQNGGPIGVLEERGRR